MALEMLMLGLSDRPGQWGKALCEWDSLSLGAGLPRGSQGGEGLAETPVGQSG